jgi:hypothetical protein
MYLRAENGLRELEDVPGEYGWPILEELGLIRIQKTHTGWDFFMTSSGVLLPDVIDNEENGAPLRHVKWWTKFEGGKNS